MSAGLERARERAGHYHQDETQQRAIAVLVHDVDDWKHRAIKAESALDLLSRAVTDSTRVITGDITNVTAELEALSVGTVIRIVEDEDGPQVFEAMAAHGHNAPPIVWSSTRSPRLVDSGYIARGETAVTILWSGETA